VVLLVREEPCDCNQVDRKPLGALGFRTDEACARSWTSVGNQTKGATVKRSRRGGRRPQNNHGGHMNHGGGGGGGGGYNPNRTFDSNGPEVKIRGSAAHVYDKYLQLARDANSSGDRVMAENYLQHAEHYFRIMAVQHAQLQQYQQQHQQLQQQGSQPQPHFGNTAEQPAPQQSAPGASIASFSPSEAGAAPDDDESGDGTE